jgi:hypothetical protein
VATKTTSLPLLFVDTNVFLSFYRSTDIGLGLLKHLESVSDSLIKADQVEFEFFKNRPSVINRVLNGIFTNAVSLPAFLINHPETASIRKHEAEIRGHVKTLRDKLKLILEKPEDNDHVLKVVNELMANPTLNLKFESKEVQKQIFDAGFARFHKNYPPRKPDDINIGDAIHWEWIKHCAKTQERDVVIHSEDGDFGADKAHLHDCLAREFTETTKQKAQLVPSLSQALRILNIKVSKAEEKAELEVIKKGPSFVHPLWPKVMERIYLKSSAAYALLNLISKVDYVRDHLTISFENQPEPIALTLLQMNIGTMMREAFEELKFAPLKWLSIGPVDGEYLMQPLIKV